MFGKQEIGEYKLEINGEKDILKNTSDYLLERVELFVAFLNALALLVIPAAICSDLGTAMTELATSSYRKTLRGK